MASISQNEKPLNRSARIGLVCGAGLTILFFYLFSLAAIILLLCVVLLELMGVLVLLRFGLAGLMTRMMERHLGLVSIFFRSFRLRKGAEFRLTLQPKDAPRLFPMLENLCKQLNVAPPREVSLEMGLNAYVRLEGYRRGSGKTILGIGYDLMAGLSEAEFEGVLAHEMVHAKLIQRGFRTWLHAGLGRLTTLVGALAQQAYAYRQAKKTFALAEMFLRIGDLLARTATGLVATYSRQDEFDADRGAAELCGTQTVRSALLKLEPLNEKASHLPWRDRVAQLQLPEGFSRWLIHEFAVEESFQPQPTTTVFNKYSTHPLLQDRIAALPATSGVGPAKASAPALELLAAPDRVASELIAEIQRVLAEEEQKDSKELRRWTRKTRRSTDLRPLQVTGLMLILGGIIGGLAAVAAAKSIIGALIGTACVVGGVMLFRRGRYRDRMQLPIPEYAAMKGWKPENLKDVDATQKQLETEFHGRLANEKKKRQKVLFLVSEAYAALAKCHYLRAHVAARLAHDIDKKSVEALLSLSVAAAALNMAEQSAWAIHSVQKLAGWKTPSTAWGAGWSLLLMGDWSRAEALLDEAAKHIPENSTLLALLALARSHRGKSQSALLSARAACELPSSHKEHAKLLINLLLEGGYWREAQERMRPLESTAENDTELLLALVRLNLLQQNLEAAEKWTEVLNRKSMEPHMTVKLGHAYAVARKKEHAAAFYRRALEAAYYPEACLGLGRLEAHSRNKEEARRHFLSALNIGRKAGESSVGSIALFQDVINELLMQQDPVADCRAWIATLTDNKAPALANQSFMVYAPSRRDADQYFQIILSALQPEVHHASATVIHWREGLQDQHPVGPVRPGVQFAFAEAR